MGSRFHWVYLTTAPDQLTAEMWSELLCNGGIPAMAHSGNIGVSHLGITNLPCRIMVPEEELSAASEVMEQLTSEVF